MEFFRATTGIGGAAAATLLAREILQDRAVDVARKDEMLRSLYAAINPGVEPTDEALSELASSLDFRSYDELFASQYEQIDRALVDLGYADNITEAATENDIVEIMGNIEGAELAVLGVGAFAAYAALNGLAGLFRSERY